MRKAEHIKAFTETIWEWYARHKRVLPWRDLAIEDDTQRAYLVLVSEIMLQQTQVSRVEVMYKKFVREFPDIEALAAASNRDVILAWRGMGYNSRALRLRDAAKKIVQDFAGVFPKKMEELLSIKGIGHYTAAAIRNFAFDLPTPCLDTNIRRILHRTFIGPEKPDGTWRISDRELLKLAEEILNVALTYDLFIHSYKKLSEGVGLAGPAPGGHHKGKGWPVEGKPLGLPSTPANWHAALMDFGSLVCTKNNPKWDICSLTKRGLMKTTKRNFERLARRRSKLKAHSSKPREPGRIIGSAFVPDRIVRGRIVEELRDTIAGLSLSQIGKRVCIDWDRHAHEAWLRAILEKLTRDEMLSSKKQRYALAA